MFFQFSNIRPRCIKKGNPTLTGYLNVLNITFIGFLFRIYKDQAFSCQIVPLWIHSNKHNQIQSDLKWSVEIAFFHLQDLIKVMFFQFSNICPNACGPFGKRRHCEFSLLTSSVNVLTIQFRCKIASGNLPKLDVYTCFAPSVFKRLKFEFQMRIISILRQ
jgi:hypothetical protein